MKCIVSAFVVLVAVSAAVPAAAAVKVFLLGGQSNMAGVGAYPGKPPQTGYGPDKPCPMPYDAPQPAVKFWNFGPGPQPNPVYGINVPGTGDGWVDLAPGYGHEPSEFGPEVSFG